MSSISRVSPGMKIFCEAPLRDRVALSSGIEEVKMINGMPCFKRAFVPSEPWTSPNEDEVKILQAEENENGIYQQLAIVTIPKELKKSFHNLKLYSCKNDADAQRIGATPAYKKVLGEFIEYFSPWHKGDDPPVPHFIYVGRPGLRTTTFNRNENFFIGMHLNSWEKKQMNERHIARNRICLNLGLDPRYFLFYNLEYRQMAKMAGFPENFLNQKNQHHYEVLYKFYELFPDYPIIRLRIDPYEAYLAPTENVVHDGTTEGCTQTDVNLGIRGYYYRDFELAKTKRKSFFNLLIRK